MWSLWSNYIRNTGEIDIGLDLGPDRCYVNNLNPSFIVHDGLTWTGAYTTIQECLDQLINTGGEVWVVGNGENNPYYPTAYRVLGTNNDADKTFKLHSFIRMYGGFTGNEVQKWERDFYNYPTYLSGDINGVTVNNLIMPGDFTLIDGFYIGYAGCNDANEVQMGGGIYADYKRFNVINSIFYALCATRWGGAIFCGQSDASVDEFTAEVFAPNIHNVVFLGNSAGWDGGAIYTAYKCNIQCKWCIFDENRASRKGGAVYSVSNSDLYFENSNFTNNYALHSGGCMAVEQYSNATFYCPVFEYNRARWEGGCLYAGKAAELQRHEGEYFQGFVVHGDYNTFMDNHLYDEVSNTWDIEDDIIGQNNVYLWPYSDYCFYEEDYCGGIIYEPTPYPTDPPQEPPYRVCGDCWSGLYDDYNTGTAEIEFRLDQASDVIIESCLSNFKTNLELWDENKRQRYGYTYSCDENENAIISAYLPTAGTYWVYVKAAEQPVMNAVYNIRIICPPPPTMDPTTKPPHTRPPTMTGQTPKPTPMETPEPSPMTTTKQPPVYWCENSICGVYDGEDIIFEFEQTIWQRPIKVIISACRSKMDTYLFVRPSGLGITAECDNCGTDMTPEDCADVNDLEAGSGTCCNGANPLASEIVQVMDVGTYYITLRGGSTQPIMGEYCIDFICIPLTPEPSWPTPLPTPISNPPTTNPPTPQHCRICCWQTKEDEYAPVVWCWFHFDTFLPEVVYNLCDSDYDTRIDVYRDKNDAIPIDGASDGCRLDTGQALLTMFDMFPRDDHYWIKITNEGDIPEPGAKWVLGIVCPVAPTPPTPPPFPTPPNTIVTSAPTPCNRELECGETVTGEYRDKPIIWEIKIPQENPKYLLADTCGSNFNTKISLMNSAFQVIPNDCNTDGGTCSCNDCGNCNVLSNGQISFPCNLGDCKLFPLSEPQLPCCAQGRLNGWVFEPQSSSIVHAPKGGVSGPYFVEISSPDSGQNGEYTLFTNCPPTITFTPSPTSWPTPPPEEPTIMYCNDVKTGYFNGEEEFIHFQLTENYGQTTEVSIDACDSTFDTYMKLYATDSEGGRQPFPMAEDDNGCSSQIPSLQSLIVQPFLLPGEYWISIGQPNGIPDQMGEWTIKIICPTPSPGSTPSPTPPEPLMCFDIIEGDFNGDKLTWAFANPYTIHITWTACLSEFDTILSITNREGIVLDYCDDCGTFFEQGDCSINIGETCCDGLVPYASEIRRYVNKGQIYYFTLDVNPGNIPQYPARFSVQLICDGVTPWPSVPSPPSWTPPPGVPSPPSWTPPPGVPSPPSWTPPPGIPSMPSWPTMYTRPPSIPSTPRPTPVPSIPTTKQPQPTTVWPSPTPRTLWPSPTPRTLWPSPTPRPWPTPQTDGTCDDRCDAFSVTVEDWYYSGSNVCVKYNVKRLTSNGYFCRLPIKYFVLGICDQNEISDIDDINGLIHSCNIDGDSDSNDDQPGWWNNDDSDDDSRPKPQPKKYSMDSGDSDESNNNWNNADSNNPESNDDRYPNWWNNNDDSGGSSKKKKKKKKKNNRNSAGWDNSDSSGRRRILYGSYTNKCFGTNSDGLYGIMINTEIEYEMSFEICFKNVFITPIIFSNIVRFRRGYDKFTCYNDWTIGLPCIDPLKFTGGMGNYDSSGFNTYGKKYGNTYKKKKKRKYKSGDSDDNAQGFGIQMVDNPQFETINPIVRWEVLSAIILFSLCFIGICIYCLILRKKRKNLQLRGTKVGTMEMIDDDDDENETDDEMEMMDNEFENDDNDNDNDNEDNNDEDRTTHNEKEGKTKTKKFIRQKFKREKYSKINRKDEIEMEHVGDNSDSDSRTMNNESTRF